MRGLGLAAVAYLKSQDCVARRAQIAFPRGAWECSELRYAGLLLNSRLLSPVSPVIAICCNNS
jgi:hypothetical protein